MAAKFDKLYEEYRDQVIPVEGAAPLRVVSPSLPTEERGAHSFREFRGPDPKTKPRKPRA